jgi:hypothetical protein
LLKTWLPEYLPISFVAAQGTPSIFQVIRPPTARDHLKSALKMGPQMTVMRQIPRSLDATGSQIRLSNL